LSPSTPSTPETSLSLKEALAKKPVSFSKTKKEPEIDRVNKVIKEALKPKDIEQ